MEDENTYCRIVFIIGPPGSGKTTAAKTLAEYMGSNNVSPGEWLRRVRDSNTDLGSYVTHNYNYDALDPLVAELVARQVALSLDQQETIVIEGFPRTPYQATLLPMLCRNEPFIVISLSDISRELAFKRLLQRELEDIKIYGCAPDHKITVESVNQRYKIWERHQSAVNGILKKWEIIHNIDGRQDIDLIMESVKNIMREGGVLVPVQLEPLNAVPQNACHFETAAIINRALTWSEATKKRRFPGTHPISLEREHLSQIVQHPYVISLKVDGTRFLVLVSEGRLWYLGRDMKVMRGRWSMNLLDWEGTMIDVEIVQNNTHCLVIDCLSIRGINVMHEGILSRMGKAHPFIPVLNQFYGHGASPQRYYSMRDLGFALQLPQQFDTDGIVFTPRSLPYRHGVDFNLFKYKEANKNTVDFKYHNERLLTKANHGHGYIDHGYLCETPDWIENGTILECLAVNISFSSKTEHQWRIQRMRRDKNEPNADWVATRVCKSIIENIPKNEILTLSGIRTVPTA